MEIERPELLREWLTTTLKTISEADPDALGKYIMALIKKDIKKDLKTFLLKQLQIFLRNETSIFVELLLETLRTKSYIKKATVSDDVKLPIKLSLKRVPTRCKHYDEKGFCLSGNFCSFDHGSDPILIDGYTSNQFLTIIKSVNYGGSPSDKYESKESPWPTLPPQPLPARITLLHLPPLQLTLSSPPPLLPPFTLPPQPFLSSPPPLPPFLTLSPPPPFPPLPPPLTLPPLPPPLTQPPLPPPTDELMENSQDEESSSNIKPLNSISVNHTEHFKAKKLVFSKPGPCHPNKVNAKHSLSKGSVSRTVVYTSNLPHHLEKKAFPKLIRATKKRTLVREESQLGITTHKIKLHQAKVQLVTKLVTQQKLILEKRMKTTKKAEKVVLKKALDIISQKIGDLTKDFEKENQELKSLLSSMFVKHTSLKVSEIAVKDDDDPPKSIFVAIEKSTDKEDLRKHFKHFGEIERWEETSGGVIVSFCTRAAAEAAFFHGTKFENSILSLSWFSDTQLNPSNCPSDSDKKLEQNTIEMISDEEEEEQEARFWCH